MKEIIICGPLACVFDIWSYYIVPLFISYRRRRDAPFLPDDVLIEILSRLPADCVVKFRRVCRHWQALTSSRCFVRLQLQRATPALLVQYELVWHPVPKQGTYVAVIGETDRKNPKYEPIRVDSQDWGRRFNPRIILSCDGLLLFKTHLQGKYYFVLNPVTYEKLVIANPMNFESRFCGFFFHPLTSEYKLLVVDKEDSGYRYFIYNFGTRMWRPLALKISFEPSRYGHHATLDGALHWIVGYDYREMPNCGNAIMVYKMDTEDFFTIPHPGNRCISETRHLSMDLFEKERNLCFCFVDFGTKVVHVWVLMDYANRTWVKKHRVGLSLSLRKFPREECRLSCWDIRLLNIWNDQLILDWDNRGIFRYHLRKEAVQKIRCPRIKFDVLDRFYYLGAFTKSLVTLA